MGLALESMKLDIDFDAIIGFSSKNYLNSENFNKKEADLRDLESNQFGSSSRKYEVAHQFRCDNQIQLEKLL